jgi:hypothetical protein
MAPAATLLLCQEGVPEVSAASQTDVHVCQFYVLLETTLLRLLRD